MARLDHVIIPRVLIGRGSLTDSSTQALLTVELEGVLAWLRAGQLCAPGLDIQGLGTVEGR